MDALAGSRVASVVVLCAAALVCLLPAFWAFPIMDGSEPGLAHAARAMVETGDIFALDRPGGGPHVAWAPRGGAWMQALTGWMFGTDTIVSFRVTSLLAGVALPVALWWASLALLRERGALLAGLFVAASGLLGLQARLATPDTAAVLMTVLAAGFLARLWVSRGIPNAATQVRSIGFWACIAITFTLGGVSAVTPLLITTGVLVLVRPETRETLRAGITLFAAAIALWLAVVALGWPSDTFDAVDLRSGPEAPPGTYLLLTPVIVGPAMSYVFAGFSWVVDHAGRPAVGFALAWIVPAWMGAEFASTKLPEFMLMAVPGFCLLAAIVTDRGVARISGAIAWLFSLGLLLWPPAIAVSTIATLATLEGSVSPLAVVLLSIGGVAGPVAWYWLWRNATIGSSVASLVMSISLIGAILAVAIPSLSAFRVAERLPIEAAAVAACPDPRLVATGLPEESVFFVSNGQARMVTAAEAADILQESHCAVAAVERRQIASFRQRAEDLGLQVVDQARLAGVSARRYVRVEMHLFTRAAEVGS